MTRARQKGSQLLPFYLIQTPRLRVNGVIIPHLTQVAQAGLRQQTHVASSCEFVSVADIGN